MHPQNPFSSVKFGLLNPRSTRNKFTLILDEISTHSFDILALTETWIPEDADNVTKYDIVPPGYHVLHSHSSRGKRGGGIFLISSNSVKLTIVKSEIHSSFEALTAQASFLTRSLTISVIYRPPNSSNFIRELTAHLYFFFSTFNHFIMAGDFNTPNCHHLDNPLNILLRKHGLTQHINNPTHRLGNTLDLVITLAFLSLILFLILSAKFLNLIISLFRAVLTSYGPTFHLIVSLLGFSGISTWPALEKMSIL